MVLLTRRLPPGCLVQPLVGHAGRTFRTDPGEHTHTLRRLGVRQRVDRAIGLMTGSAANGIGEIGFAPSPSTSRSAGRHRSERLRVLRAGVRKLRIGGTAVTVESDVGAVSAWKKTGTTTVRYETSTTIDRPIGDVFARLADLDGYRTWMHRRGLFRRSGQTSDGPRGSGTAYFDATRMGTFRGQITVYQPPSRIGFRETLRWFGSDLMEARPEYLLEADRDRTIVHHIAEGELFGLMRLMKPVAALLARSERTRTVKSLRRSLESG
jgi:uncharacterized protein YndB with AHSA1/START domain